MSKSTGDIVGANRVFVLETIKYKYRKGCFVIELLCECGGTRDETEMRAIVRIEGPLHVFEVVGRRYCHDNPKKVIDGW